MNAFFVSIRDQIQVYVGEVLVCIHCIRDHSVEAFWTRFSVTTQVAAKFVKIS